MKGQTNVLLSDIILNPTEKNIVFVTIGFRIMNNNKRSCYLILK